MTHLHAATSLHTRLLAAGLMGLFVHAAHAMPIDQDCQPEDLAPVETWLAKHPFVEGSTSPDALVSAACKPSPRDPSLTIVAAAYAQAPDPPNDKSVVVALVDTQAARVRSVFKGTIAETTNSALRLGNLHLDTAPYDLAPGVRAFGVDVRSIADPPRCAEGGSDTWRTLFVQDGAALRPVLEGFALSSWRYAKDPDCFTVRNDPRIAQTTRSTIAIGPRGAKGFADLVVTESTDSGSGSRPQRTARYVLHYDGAHYRSDDHPGDAVIVPQAAPSTR